MPASRIVVGLSGGVDSSIAALLLLEQGHEVHGAFMKNWEETFEPGYCTAAADLEDAREVCATLGIPLHVVNFTAEYRNRVFAQVLDDYRRGRTPNPDVLCNQEIKFRVFLDYAQSLGAAAVATGHYARRVEREGRWRLHKGVDSGKDQSYFLYTLDQQRLSEALFPLGGMNKRQVRALAAAAGLVTHDKKDSTGICFIGERDFPQFLARYLPTEPGDIRSPEGKKLGEHQGLAFYTLGQRQGLGIGGSRGGSGAPWYVAAKDRDNNVLIAVQGHQHPLLLYRRLSVSRLHWISGAAPVLPLHCQAKTRYRQPDQPCTVAPWGDQGGEVTFAEPQWAVTPGQSVVLYQGDECLGGGVIEVAFH